MNKEQKDKFFKQIKDKKIWFCPLPFTHVFSALNGRYAPCYDSHQNYYDKYGNHLKGIGHYAQKSTPKQWYESEFQQGLRKEMLSENPNREYLDIICEGCVKQEKKYGRSDREKYCEQVLNETFDSKVPELLRQVQKFKENGEIKLDERILDIKMKIFGNACNLDCYMCTPRSANTRTISLKKIGKVYDPDLDPADGERMNALKHDSEEVLNNIASVAKWTRSIKLIGGEPLVMKNHYKLLDKLVKTGYSKDIDLIYKTNLSVFKMDNYDFRNYWGQFKEFVMKISIDSYGKYNDYIRKKSDWPQLINNMMIMKARKDSRVNVHSVVSFLSVMHIWRLQEYLKEIDIPHTYYIIQHPAILQVKNLPYEIKQSLIPKYKNYPNIIKSLEAKQDKSEFIKTIEYCQALDRNHNNYKLFELYPELEKYYNEAKIQQSNS